MENAALLLPLPQKRKLEITFTKIGLWADLSRTPLCSLPRLVLKGAGRWGPFPPQQTLPGGAGPHGKRSRRRPGREPGEAARTPKHLPPCRAPSPESQMDQSPKINK